MYPILIHDPENTSKLASIMNEFGMSFDQFRLWFKSKQQAVNWIQAHITPQAREAHMQRYCDEMKLAQQNAPLAHDPELATEWMEIVHATEITDVLFHYAQAFVI